MTYGQEVPFSSSSCDQNTTCSISTAEGVSVTTQVSINGGVTLRKRDISDVELQAAFNIGATYSYSKSLSYTVTAGQQKILNANQCGYWTFVPYMME